ncbi:MAG: (2Fe-2S)-binding protein [Solirubrobacterales bacterium]|nr:(2Fe-2S)-binding protein [Solirubrobacterales bacterium]
MQLNVNGVSRAVASPPLTPLLRVLREELDVLSPKQGCEQGGCGACTVLVDGEPRRSCLLPIAVVGEAAVTTVEGLGAPGDLTPVQAAFHDRYAAQCGYCTSGMLLAAYALIERKGGPVDRDEVLEALSGHVCRCTGYVKIVDAVMAASRGEIEVTQVDETPAPDPSEPEIELKGAPA